jgi:hypothetical protein
MTRRWNLEFVALLLGVVLVNAPYWSAARLPIHDTLFHVQAFHVFYSEWVANGELARWIPYGTYGWTSAVEQLTFLSPVTYVVAILGRLLRVADALALFKTVLLLEQCVLVAGMYLVSRRLFARRSTVWMVCLATLGSTVWYAQSYFNFRMVYLFPLVVYGLVRFTESRRSAWAWAAGIVTIVWALGNVAYFAAIWAFAVLILALAIGLRDRALWRLLGERSASNLLPMGAFVLLAAGYAHQAFHATEGAFLFSGREGSSGVVGIQSFLYHGGRAEPGAVLRSLLLGWPTHLPWGAQRDNSVYVGLLPVVAFAWSLTAVRQPWHAALLAAVVGLVWLSWGGFFAAAAYYASPLMNRYRHIGLVYGLAKLLMLLCAGFGWEALWSAKPRIGALLALGVGLLFVVDACRLAGPFDFYELLKRPAQALALLRGRLSAEGVWPVVLAARLAGYAGLAAAAAVAASRRWIPRPALALPAALVLALALDLAWYQAVVFAEAPRVAVDATHRQLTRVARLPYHAQRLAQPADARGGRALRLVRDPAVGGAYALAHAWAQHDPCETELRADWWPAAARRLLEARGTAQWWEARDPVLAQALGCAPTPKLRLVTQAAFAQTEQDAEALVRQATDLDRTVVLRGAASEVSEDGAEAGDVRVLAFTANALTVEVDVAAAGGAWLVYADGAHPHWRAAVNGRPAPIAEADLAFKAVRVPPGRSRVDWHFERGVRAWPRALCAAIATAAGLALLGLVGALALVPGFGNPDRIPART